MGTIVYVTPLIDFISYRILMGWHFDRINSVIETLGKIDCQLKTVGEKSFNGKKRILVTTLFATGAVIELLNFSNQITFQLCGNVLLQAILYGIFVSYTSYHFEKKMSQTDLQINPIFSFVWSNLYAFQMFAWILLLYVSYYSVTLRIRQLSVFLQKNLVKQNCDTSENDGEIVQSSSDQLNKRYHQYLLCKLDNFFIFTLIQLSRYVKAAGKFENIKFAICPDLSSVTRTEFCISHPDSYDACCWCHNHHFSFVFLYL